ncbi:MAG: glycosyl transferase [Bacteroidetes bacterium 4572_77]|nr:MAG: glycosyl transferase [Bacteroidetes bacterium 4572_77]
MIVHKLGAKGYLNWIPDKWFIQIVYRCDSGEKLNLNNPTKFSEKIQWTKLYDRKPQYKTYVDKFAARDMIREKIGEKYLIPLYNVYDSTDAIEWSKLPKDFVMKCSHDSGSSIICNDKSKLNIEDTIKKLKFHLKRDWFWFAREWAYKGIKPRIIVEKNISEGKNTPDDYKILCFNGKASEIEVHKDRYQKIKLQTYDVHWNHLRVKFEGYGEFEEKLEKPACLDEMISLSEILAEDTIIARIDWYISSGKLYFGEITLYESAGFFGTDDMDWNIRVGKLIDIHKTK